MLHEFSECTKDTLLPKAFHAHLAMYMLIKVIAECRVITTLCRTIATNFTNFVKVTVFHCCDNNELATILVCQK